MYIYLKDNGDKSTSSHIWLRHKWRSMYISVLQWKNTQRCTWQAHRVNMYVCASTYTHTYIYTCVHTCIHTYIYVYIYLFIWISVITWKNTRRCTYKVVKTHMVPYFYRSISAKEPYNEWLFCGKRPATYKASYASSPLCSKLSFTCVAWLIRRCDTIHSHVWHDPFTGVTWLCHMCDMTHVTRVTWLIHMCDMTHSHVWHDSFTCVTWLIHMCDMTHSHVW